MLIAIPKTPTHTLARNVARNSQCMVMKPGGSIALKQLTEKQQKKRLKIYKIKKGAGMDIDEVINGWTFEETIKTAENLMGVEKNMFKWDVIRHLRDFAETYREQLKYYRKLEELIGIPLKELAEIFRQHIPDDCKHPQKAIVLTDGDVDKWREYKAFEKDGRLLKIPHPEKSEECRECVHTRASCHHTESKCSECPMTELFCEEFYRAIDRCYEYTYASGCLAGIELGKSEAEAKLKELRGGEYD